MWKYGRFTFFQDHPPLGRKIIAAPIHFFTDASIDLMHWSSWDIPKGLRPEQLQYARYPVVAMGVGLGIALWLTTARLFSESAACFALALFAFSPNLISHFSLATTDGIGTVTFFLGVVAFGMWVNRPNWKQAIWLGFAVGVMLISKFSNTPMALVMFVLMIFESLRRREIGVLKQLVAVAAISFFLICSSYNWHVGRFHFESGVMTAHFQHSEQDWVASVPFKSSFTIYIPGGDFLDGLGVLYRHNRAGHGYPYLLGQTAPTDRGYRSYFLWAALLKWPNVTLALGIAGIVALAWRKVPVSRAFWMAAILPTAFYLLALMAHIQIGERHILPVYPFILVAAGALWQYSSQSRNLLVAVAVLAISNAVDVMRYAPDYLSYFTPFVRQEETWKYLADSNLDWGQGLIALKHYQEAHPDETLYVRNFGGYDASYYGVHCTKFARGDHPRGTVIISANDRAGYDVQNHELDWLWEYPQVDFLNHTLLVFRTDRTY
jgi:hypothetical protein